MASLGALRLEDIAGHPHTALPAAAADVRSWTAILLAGERPGGDPLARHFGAASKASILVGGVSMIRRVADALLAVPEIGRIIILAQDPDAVLSGDAAVLGVNPRVEFVQSGAGIASSISAVINSGTVEWPVLVTTADHALLTPEMVQEFIAGAQDCDLAVGFGDRRTMEASYPETRRTWLKFADGHFSGANLFAFRNPRVAAALRMWSEVEQDRKKGFKLLSSFGPLLLVQAVARRIGLPEALARAGIGLGVFARAVVMRDPEAAIDVDKPSDHLLAERILQIRAGNLAGLAPVETHVAN